MREWRHWRRQCTLVASDTRVDWVLLTSWIVSVATIGLIDALERNIARLSRGYVRIRELSALDPPASWGTLVLLGSFESEHSVLDYGC